MRLGQIASCKRPLSHYQPVRSVSQQADKRACDLRWRNVVRCYHKSRRQCCASRTAAASAPVPAPQDDPAQQKHFWRIVVPTGLTLLLCNMDRICMSVAILPMAADFGWSPSLQGLAQAAFLWGYMVTQLVGGSLADQLGGKAVISNAIKVFSLASLILPLAIGVVPAAHALAVVLASRFLGAFLSSSHPVNPSRVCRASAVSGL